MRPHPDHPQLRLLDHPLIQHRLTRMRATTCPTPEFRRLMREIGALMAADVTRDFPLTTTRIETPLTEMDAPVLEGGDGVCLVPVLRAGLTLAEGLETALPWADIGHIGVYRDHETHMPVEYLVKLPPAGDRRFIVVDPMLATGNSAIHALDVLKRHGVAGSDIRLAALVAAPEGVTALQKAHGEVRVYACALDSHLNENAYIVPGLGDAGDRLFGTA
ncbi:MAG TPA: uracil phosphoribosyltransferase [Azospirillaceae bacterium]|nr:uracil phosphoribosyltransferase [Azospirillaceae bacterium]